MSDWETKHRLSYHESGHAVSAIAMGVAVVKVSIVANERSSGHCVPGKFDKRRFLWRDISIDEVVCDVAGHVCERMQFGNVIVPSHSDVVGATIRAREIAAQAGFHCIDLLGEEIIRAAKMEAEKLLHANWSKVLRMTFALLRHGTLEWDAVDEAIKPLPSTLERERRINKARRRHEHGRRDTVVGGVRTITYTAANAPPSMRALFETMQIRNDGGMIL